MCLFPLSIFCNYISFLPVSSVYTSRAIAGTSDNGNIKVWNKYENSITGRCTLSRIEYIIRDC